MLKFIQSLGVHPFRDRTPLETIQYVQVTFKSDRDCQGKEGDMEVGPQGMNPGDSTVPTGLLFWGGGVGVESKAILEDQKDMVLCTDLSGMIRANRFARSIRANRVIRANRKFK